MYNKGRSLGRRNFLGAAGVLAPVAGSLGALQAADRPGAGPKNIIFMVADGMSAGVLALADNFSQLARGKGLLWKALLSRPEATNALMDMSSLNSVTTDSSAAASSWGSGSRILNGWVNMLPDGTRLTPIAAVARERGRRVGLVTTASVSHATPAGFAAVSKGRSDEPAIAAQYLGLVDVVLGGGLNFFSAARQSDKQDLVERFRRGGYQWTPSRDELLALLKSRPALTADSKLLGLFSPSMAPYTLDRNNSAELQKSTPTLAEMTEAALAVLEKSPKGFLLQVEGARVDHAAHNNDAAALVWEQIAFDEAIETVLKFAAWNPETLIVITTDHGNSNPGMGGRWAEYRSKTNGFAALAKAKQSFEKLMPALAGPKKEKLEAGVVRDLATEGLGLEFSAEEVEAVRSAAAGVKGLCLNKRLDSMAGILGQAAGNHNGITWASGDHTSDHVVLTALGPGRERFHGYLRNTRCFDNMADLMGSDFRNPSMTIEDAMKHLRASVGRSDECHWV
ncbi:MAG: hypothetical protein C0504_07390 [Candidatus Solibacter sp.]|nr:hypothetical protein [Candidatus Solibacter sp.]